mmetsp:Transcript_14381/g.27339  ORF Transcript_14381/g.27339 Transcript_14381/m.27339 type:complete len:266 (+) Transcript_14381:1500-2297(+)
MSRIGLEPALEVDHLVRDAGGLLDGPVPILGPVGAVGAGAAVRGGDGAIDEGGGYGGHGHFVFVRSSGARGSFRGARGGCCSRSSAEGHARHGGGRRGLLSLVLHLGHLEERRVAHHGDGPDRSARLGGLGQELALRLGLGGGAVGLRRERVDLLARRRQRRRHRHLPQGLVLLLVLALRRPRHLPLLHVPQDVRLHGREELLLLPFLLLDGPPLVVGRELEGLAPLRLPRDRVVVVRPPGLGVDGRLPVASGLLLLLLRLRGRR